MEQVMHAKEAKTPSQQMASPSLPEGLRLIRAANPSPLTGSGTNSWIVGEGAVAVIDPGPDLDQHLHAILAALAPGEHVSHILLTHPHVDHSGLAPALARATGAPTFAFGTADAGLSPAMRELARQGDLAGGEGADRDFAPDITLADGARIDGAGWSLTAIHTPGHMGAHLAFDWQGRVFSGDHVMGWASTLISPPEGDMGAYMASLARLAALAPRLLLPGHGPIVTDPAARIAELTAHRRRREAEVLAGLAPRPCTAAELAAAIYRDLAPALLPAAARNVLAHLLDLQQRGKVAPETRPPGPATRFALS